MIGTLHMPGLAPRVLGTCGSPLIQGSATLLSGCPATTPVSAL